MTDSPIEKIQAEAIKARVVEALHACYDPEIPVNIYDLGLIYDVDVNASGIVHITMTLTSPTCPVAGTLPPEIESRVKALDDVRQATVEVVWDPPWTPQKMTEAARLQLNI